jgi:hypothetical protein
LEFHLISAIELKRTRDELRKLREQERISRGPFNNAHGVSVLLQVMPDGYLGRFIDSETYFYIKKKSPGTKNRFTPLEFMIRQAIELKQTRDTPGGLQEQEKP